MDYIQNLIVNHPKSNDNCEDVDLILESGAANGGYHIGCLSYIKALEQKNIVKVNRISGASIGAVSGFYYLTNSLHEFLEDYKKFRECFKKNLNVCVLKDILDEKINKLTDDDFDSLNNKLHITFHDVEKREQIMINTFAEKKDLLHSLLKSCHVPFFTQNSMFYIEDEKEFFDGGMPYIFPERTQTDNKLIYITVSQLDKLKCIFSIKKELNPHERILEAALDTHQFFLHNTKGKFCSIINDWTMKDFLKLRLKQLVFKILFYNAVVCGYIIKKFYPFVSNFRIIHFFSPIVYNFYRDTLLFYCL